MGWSGICGGLFIGRWIDGQARSSARAAPPPFTGEGDHAKHGGGGGKELGGCGRPLHRAFLRSVRPILNRLVRPTARAPVPLPRCAVEEPLVALHSTRNKHRKNSKCQ